MWREGSREGVKQKNGSKEGNTGERQRGARKYIRKCVNG